MAKHLIFVYGTLKRGWGNNVIIHDQKFVGPATTTDSKFSMHSLGGYPGVVAGGSKVIGEVWEVDDKAFQRCDNLEGHPNFYKREEINVIIHVGEDGVQVKAWIYIYQGDVSKRPVITEWRYD